MPVPVVRLRPGDLRPLEVAEPGIVAGTFVVYETDRGLECGPALLLPESIVELRVDGPAVPLVRVATQADRLQLETKWREEAKALRTCAERVAAHGLGMDLVDAVYTFDFVRLTFHYTAEGRVDFRELLKDLTTVFRRTRIELRQIGVRDEARMLGGVGACGKELCCSTFLKAFMPITMKMARDQNLPANPSKNSGMCGRLKCCLSYEHAMVLEVRQELPMVGTPVVTPQGPGVVTAVDPANIAVRVELDEDGRELRLPGERILATDHGGRVT
ncbi:MAG: regulatory iron-sulfur-containing complex subunit RicT [Candidatus Sericytochromatia bacterium]|nr:regulatory iron-sulfur-containing complex subunit RicT [Candidatus Sericytochromatia bacterium]